jgi:hypothetical protein
MELVRVLPSAEDEVNVACFHPSPGGGLVYGTKVNQQLDRQQRWCIICTYWCFHWFWTIGREAQDPATQWCRRGKHGAELLYRGKYAWGSVLPSKQLPSMIMSRSRLPCVSLDKAWHAPCVGVCWGGCRNLHRGVCSERIFSILP